MKLQDICLEKLYLILIKFLLLGLLARPQCRRELLHHVVC